LGAAREQSTPLDGRSLRIADRFLEPIRRETGLNTDTCDGNGVIIRGTLSSRLGDEPSGSQRIKHKLICHIR
jgi:hypothetical protein